MSADEISQLAERIANELTYKSMAKSQFTQMLVKLSKEPLQYEDNDLLDFAMTKIPVDQFYQAADKKHQEDDSWSEQDYVIQEMVKYDFFFFLLSIFFVLLIQSNSAQMVQRRVFSLGKQSSLRFLRRRN